jgi:hypothetical protein
MEILNDEKAMKYVGGFRLTKTIAALIGGVAAFVLGIIDGLSNPRRCGN